MRYSKRECADCPVLDDVFDKLLAKGLFLHPLIVCFVKLFKVFIDDIQLLKQSFLLPHRARRNTQGNRPE